MNCNSYALKKKFPNLIDFTMKNLGSFAFELIFSSQVFDWVANFAQ